MNISEWCMSDSTINQPSLIYENENWMVYNKPSQWHSVRPGHQSTSDQVGEPSVEKFLEEKYSWARTIPECGIVHRLDYLTSGCLLIARSEPEQLRLRSMFKDTNQSVVKSYYAVVKHQLAPQTGEFTLYFSSRYRRSKKITVRNEGIENQRGCCKWHIQNYIPQSGSSIQPCDVLVVDILGPGKRHQIRAGLAHLGFPIHGDQLYGGRYPWQGGFGLHACRLCIDNQKIECPPPESWNLIIQ